MLCHYYHLNCHAVMRANWEIIELGWGGRGGQACITNVSRGFIEQSKKELHSIPRSFFAPKLYGNFHPRNVLERLVNNVENGCFSKVI